MRYIIINSFLYSIPAVKKYIKAGLNGDEVSDLKDQRLCAYGKHRDIHFWVMSYSSHPCAYVHLEKEGQKDYDEVHFPCHGGLTYSGALFDEGPWVYGWDYAHGMDYTHYARGCVDHGHKYSIQEIIKEIEQNIDEYLDHQ